MKQEEYFIPMTDEYKEQHFPGGFFETMERNSRKNMKATYMFAGLLIAFFCIPLLAGIRMLMTASGSGSTIIGLFFAAAGFFFIMIGVGLIRISRKRGSLGVDGFIRVCAQGSGYSEEDIRTFGSQATAEGSYAVQLQGKAEAGSWGLGILTEDFVFFSASDRLLMKREDIVLACLEEVEGVEGSGKNKKKVHYPEIVLVSGKKEFLRMRTSKEGGRKLQAMLKKQDNAIDTADGKILSEKEFNTYFHAKFS